MQVAESRISNAQGQKVGEMERHNVTTTLYGQKYEDTLVINEFRLHPLLTGA